MRASKGAAKAAPILTHTELTALRNSLGLSNAGLAAMCGRQTETVRKWLSGKLPIRPEGVENLPDALDNLVNLAGAYSDIIRDRLPPAE